MLIYETNDIKNLLDNIMANEDKETVSIGNNVYYIMNTYSELNIINKQHGFIEIVDYKEDDNKYLNHNIGEKLNNKYFIINFDLDLRVMKEELDMIYEYSYFYNCILLGELINSNTLDMGFFQGGLILENCIITGKIDFVFNPIYFEANRCKFMDKIKFHDLADTFSASFSEFEDIDIETHAIGNIYFSECSGQRFEICFDYHEPNLDSFRMEYCDFKSVSINSNEFADKIISIKLSLIDCKFKSLDILKLHSKELIIDRSNIGNVVIRKSIISQEFMFTDYSFDTINFSGTYFTGKRIFELGFIEDTDMYKTFNYNISDEELIYNIEAFLRLAIEDDNPEVKLKLKYVKDVQKNKVFNKGIKFKFNRILDITTGYFTDYIKIIRTMIIIIIIFGFIYTLFSQYILLEGVPLNTYANNNLIVIIFNSLYFSLVTFTTIVYGDMSPIGFIKLLAGIEGLLGVITTASLVTVFARKFT